MDMGWHRGTGWDNLDPQATHPRSTKCRPIFWVDTWSTRGVWCGRQDGDLRAGVPQGGAKANAGEGRAPARRAAPPQAALGRTPGPDMIWGRVCLKQKKECTYATMYQCPPPPPAAHAPQPPATPHRTKSHRHHRPRAMSHVNKHTHRQYACKRNHNNSQILLLPTHWVPSSAIEMPGALRPASATPWASAYQQHISRDHRVCSASQPRPGCNLIAGAHIGMSVIFYIISGRS